MISAYVPFFPMERKHVKECIKDFLVVKGFFKKKEDIPETKISDIAGELNYYPENEQVFSLTGCKRIEDKMVLFMKDDDDGNYIASSKIKVVNISEMNVKIYHYFFFPIVFLFYLNLPCFDNVYHFLNCKHGICLYDFYTKDK